MEKGRLEAFSDGVIAIIITIMVLELKVPHGDTWAALDSDLLSKFASYAMSFLYVGIYWNNHHHLLKSAERVSAGILWSNLLLLFWLSLVPFATAWTGESKFASAPTALYGAVLLLSAMSYWVLQKAIIAEHGRESLLARAIGRDFKGNLSPLIYLTAMGLAFTCPLVSNMLYLSVALIWLVPDKRIERMLRESKRE